MKTHEVLEPVYELEVTEYQINTDHIRMDARNVTFENIGSYAVQINGKTLLPGENWIIDTDGIITGRFHLNFIENNLFSTLPPTQLKCSEGKKVLAMTTRKGMYKIVKYNIANG